MVLTGDGGDEMFGGYPHYHTEAILNSIGKIPKFVRNGIMGNILKTLPNTPSAQFNYQKNRLLCNLERIDIPPETRFFSRHQVFDDEAKAKGEVKNPRENVLKFLTVHPDVIHFNTTRVIGKSSLDGWETTEAEIEGRRQVDDMVRFLKKYVKGFEKSYLMKMGSQIGVRESRRIMGKYVLTADDVLSARHFEDGIACASYPIDIHNPTGTGTDIRRLKDGTFYKIPYRCLVPEGIDNLLIASRCISATHEAHSSLRVMPIVWAIGEAAGTAASFCLQKKIKPVDVDAGELRKKLTEQGAFV